MNNLIDQLSTREHTYLQHIVRKLVKSLRPTFIYCYGTRQVINHNKSCFALQPVRETRQLSYDLVIIISDEEMRPNKELFALVNTAILPGVKVNTILHRRAYVFQELENGHFFFSWLLQAGICLYGKDNLPPEGFHTHKPGKGISLYSSTKLQVEQLLMQGSRAWRQAKQCQQQGQGGGVLLQIRASCLHSLRALLWGGIGYRPAASSLSILLGYTHNITPLAAKLFPGQTAEEVRLYRLMTDKSTEQELSPTDKELDILQERAEKLNRVVAIVLSQKRQVLKMGGDAH
jgi:hypothetical protein